MKKLAKKTKPLRQRQGNPVLDRERDSIVSLVQFKAWPPEEVLSLAEKIAQHILDRQEQERADPRAKGPLPVFCFPRHDLPKIKPIIGGKETTDPDAGRKDFGCGYRGEGEQFRSR